jgi:hypothetical protein
MTKKEIEKIIAKDKARIERAKDRIADAKADIAATKEAIAFWKGELKKATKGKED